MAYGIDPYSTQLGSAVLRDYRHASKIFRSDGYNNSPRQKFLFHVYFNLNTAEIPSLKNIVPGSDSSKIGILVKTVDLPKFQIDTDTLIQYNRKRIIQTRINYEPIQAVFHDDGGDLIRQMWYAYYSYYYKDPTHKYKNIPNQNGSIGNSNIIGNGVDYNTRDIYNNTRTTNDWGYVGEGYADGFTPSLFGGKPAFFRDISIYGFNQKRFVEYTLINPTIMNWTHDTYDYSAGDGVMENVVTLGYEAVKYYNGAIGANRPDNNVQGFAAPENYDIDPSPLVSTTSQTSTSVHNGNFINFTNGKVQDVQATSTQSVIGSVQQNQIANFQQVQPLPVSNAVPQSQVTTTGTSTTGSSTQTAFFPV